MPSISKVDPDGDGLNTAKDLKAGFQIPIVDFSKFLSGSEDDKVACAKEILHGFTFSGFIYLSNAGISQETVDNAFSWSKRFFALPIEEKMKLEWESPESNRGYVAPGREKVSRLEDSEVIGKLRAAAPDLKESIEIGKEPSDKYQNRWPESLPGFHEEMNKFYNSCHALHVEVLSAIAIGLGLEPRYFDAFTDHRDNNLRLLHYPSVPKSAFDNAGQARAGAHTDYGTMTLLFQDDRGGLEVMSPKGQYVPATPIPGTIVVNAADLLERWSNDVIKSTEHRVVAPPSPPTDDKYPDRYSIAYFCNPNWDATISCLDRCYGDAVDGREKKYDAINCHQYLISRLAATY